MSDRTLATTLRMPVQMADRLDQTARLHGFATRSKFLIHASLTYNGTVDDQIAAQIARTNFALHQANLASAQKLHLLKSRDVALIADRAIAALDAVVDRNIR